MLDCIESAQWKGEIEVIRAAHRRLVEALIALDPAMLDQPAGARTARPAAELIHGVAEHTLYHTAQMEMLKTLAKHVGQ